MSSRDPLWYCHECHAEMRPLMAPHPTCASCHGSFVEIMENPADDPRAFSAPGIPGGFGEGPVPVDGMLFALQTLMSRGLGEQRRRRTTDSNNSSNLSFQFRSANGGTRAFTLGGPRTLGGGAGSLSDDPPTMSEFLRRRPSNGDRGSIAGPLMAQYLMALMGQQYPPGMDGEALERGRFGDYVFSQEALDQIITQIMENSNTSRPVPAPEDKINELPKEVLEEGSQLLQKDCAICKDQFQLNTEDPEEQIVVTLPCKHPFHEPCITPWLKSSGTCPVCRYALVPQPDHHPEPGNANSRPSSPRTPSNNSSNEPPNLFQALFNVMGSGSGNNTGSGTQRQNSTNPSVRPTSDSARDSSSQSGPYRHVPGEWHEDLD